MVLIERIEKKVDHIERSVDRIQGMGSQLVANGRPVPATFDLTTPETPKMPSTSLNDSVNATSNFSNFHFYWYQKFKRACRQCILFIGIIILQVNAVWILVLYVVVHQIYLSLLGLLLWDHPA